MRIGVDMAATAGEKTGLGYYVENIVRSLRDLPGDHELVEIQTVKKDLNTPKRMLWDRAGLPMMARMKKVDMLFVPAFSAPKFPKPVVMTAHDIFGLLYPEQFEGPARRYWSHVLPQSMKRADHLICISEHTQGDIQKHLGISEDKMTVIPQAASDDFRILDNVHAVEKHLKELDVEPPFILSVGTLEPRKNFERLIEAYVFSDRRDVKLVLVGKKGWKYDGVFEKIRKYHLQNNVVYLDYVSQDQLVALYNACLFFVMPSLYEGFGFPALEAMKCGAPVAVSQNSSLPEVVGEAGVLFDPYDVESIRARMDLLFRDDAMRQQMQQKSVDQAMKFSWNRTARETLEVFHQVMERVR